MHLVNDALERQIVHRITEGLPVADGYGIGVGEERGNEACRAVRADPVDVNSNHLVWQVAGPVIDAHHVVPCPGRRSDTGSDSINGTAATIAHLKEKLAA